MHSFLWMMLLRWNLLQQHSFKFRRKCFFELNYSLCIVAPKWAHRTQCKACTCVMNIQRIIFEASVRSLFWLWNAHSTGISFARPKLRYLLSRCASFPQHQHLAFFTLPVQLSLFFFNLKPVNNKHEGRRHAPFVQLISTQLTII